MNQTRHGDNSWFSLAAIPWVILGVFLNPMFIGVAGMMLAASYQRNRLLSGLLVGFGVLFLLFVLCSARTWRSGMPPLQKAR